MEDLHLDNNANPAAPEHVANGSVNGSSSPAQYTAMQIRLNGTTLSCAALDNDDPRWSPPTWDDYQEMVFDYADLTLEGIILTKGGPVIDSITLPFLEHFEAFTLCTKFIHNASGVLEGASVDDLQHAIEEWLTKSGHKALPIPAGVMMLALLREDCVIYRKRKSANLFIGHPLNHHRPALKPCTVPAASIPSNKPNKAGATEKPIASITLAELWAEFTRGT